MAEQDLFTTATATIFPSGSKIYIGHLASEGSAEAEFRQSFPAGTSITSIKIFHKTTKTEVWSILGWYRYEDTGMFSFYTGIYINGELIGSFPLEMEYGKEYSIDIPLNKIKLDGSLNTIKIAYGKFTFGDSNAYQIWFETRIEIEAEQSPTETSVEVTTTTSREEAATTEVSYEMMGQLMEFMMTFMMISMIMSIMSAMMEGLAGG